ncbi:probable carboxylesterase 18 [Rutidosis leptorrhynchoides]|uniref:probable carboxylesterase 18 n=1 Tax=Rutidosis leptorrhynchoides TaxID=125765 RepID=UPI003A99CE3D
METVTPKSQKSPSIPWKTRFVLSVFSTTINIASRKNGTVNRSLHKLLESRAPPNSKPINGVRTYDVMVDQTRKLWFRVFVPTEHLEDIPVIMYYHGGGFVYLSPNVKAYDVLCREFAKKVPAVVVSVNYRLAPENRYPAQHNDCFDVLKYLDDEENRSKALPKNANISRCFLAGDSAGGNLAHHVTQKVCESNFQQLKVIGVVAILPFFGGEERTDSERQFRNTPLVSMKMIDWFWKVFMPPGEDNNRDHPIINVSGPKAVDISNIDFPATIVIMAGFDTLRDRQKMYYEWMKKSGKEVYLVDYPKMCHGFYLFSELIETGQLISEVKEFIHKVLDKVLRN